MNFEDLEPTKPPTKPKDLAPLSVVDLKAYIERLREEILRVEAEIARKESHRANVAGLFKS